MGRISYIDSSRGLALILAMFSHSLYQFAAGIDIIVDHRILIHLFTRTATPTFMILFGIMIEVVYLRRVRNGAPGAPVRARMLERMVTCYVLFALATFAAALTGKMSFGQALLAILYTDTGRFGVILQVYAVLFLFIALTLPLGVRYGSLFYGTVALSGWILKFTLAALPVPPLFSLQFFTGYAEGFGPAILPGMTFVAFGVTLGEAFTGRRSRKFAISALLVSAVILLTGVLTSGPADFASKVVDTFRWNNSFYYYAFGIVSACTWLAMFAAIRQVTSETAPRWSFDTLGRETLFMYGGGNILINLLPIYYGSRLVGFGFLALFMGLLIVSTVYKPEFSKAANQGTGGLVSQINRLYRRLVGGAIARLQGTSAPPFER